MPGKSFYLGITANWNILRQVSGMRAVAKLYVRQLK